MQKLLILALLCSLALTQCDFNTQLWYQGACVQKSCLQDKLQKFRLTPKIGMETVGNQGKLSTAILYGAQQFSDAQGNYYRVLIRYGDDQANQILGDPANCIQYRIYNTANSFEIDSTRRFVVQNGDEPTWPQSVYTYDGAGQFAQLQFDIRQTNLEQTCLRINGANSIEYTCFFELAFLVRRITQVSYYFSVRVVVNTGINNQGPNRVNFVKLVEVDECPQGGSGTNNCLVNVNIASKLSFCKDSTCNQISDNPFNTLFLNREFYMLHQIQDVSFQTWYINNARVFFQAIGLTLTLGPGELVVFKKEKGYNIYKLSVPIVQPDVLITATGVISQTSARRLLEGEEAPAGESGIKEGEQGVVRASQRSGEIKTEDQALDSAAATDDSAALKDDSDSSNAELLCLASSMFIYALLH